MARTTLFTAGCALLLATFATPVYADVARDLARLIQTQGTNPLGFIRGLRSLGNVEIGEADIRRALSILPRSVQTNNDIRRLVDPVTRIRIDGQTVEIDRSSSTTLGFGARAVKLEKRIRLRVRSSGSDVVVDKIKGIRAGSPQSLYKLSKVTFTTLNGKPVAKVVVVLSRFLGLTNEAIIPLDASAAEALDPMANGMDPALLKEVQGLLEALGYDVDVDGKWGPQTEKAVKAFQTDENIEVDGQVGHQTLRHLRAASGRLAGRRGGVAGSQRSGQRSGQRGGLTGGLTGRAGHN